MQTHTLTIKTITQSGSSTMTEHPRLFISYSWSSQVHEKWVLNLATELVESGVDVILDKWHLREGQDAISFMEQMVSDPSVNKVALICDKVYVEKAIQRTGGVGTETQIISPELYSQQDQKKFVAVIAEKDPDGQPYLPIYYKSRVYIDLSEGNRYTDGFEQMLRWIYDKPLNVRPPLGKQPDFLLNPNQSTFGTSALARRTIDAFKDGKSISYAALAEYLRLFSERMAASRIDYSDPDFDESVVKSIESFIPQRNEYIHVIETLSQFSDIAQFVSHLQVFFESLIPYLFPPADRGSFREIESDNLKFIVHEMFIYTIGILLKYRHYEGACSFLSQKFYVNGSSSRQPSGLANYFIFRKYMRSLENRNNRLRLNRISLRADLLMERSRSSGVSFEQLMQADFVCLLRSVSMNETRSPGWYPETLVFSSRQYGPFEIFVRARSRNVLSRILPLLGVSTKEDLEGVVETVSSGQTYGPIWDHGFIDPSDLVGIENLGSVE